VKGDTSLTVADPTTQGQAWSLRGSQMQVTVALTRASINSRHRHMSSLVRASKHPSIQAVASDQACSYGKPHEAIKNSSGPIFVLARRQRCMWRSPPAARVPSKSQHRVSRLASSSSSWPEANEHATATVSCPKQGLWVICSRAMMADVAASLVRKLERSWLPVKSLQREASDNARKASLASYQGLL